MTAAHAHQSADDDPREFERIPVSRLVIDARLQREIDQRPQRIAHEWNWALFEALTVWIDREGLAHVVEGQHRGRAAQLRAAKLGEDFTVPCMVLPARTSEAQQAGIGLEISKGRSPHSPYAQWWQRYRRGDPHEILAIEVLNRRELQIGKAASAMTIGAVAAIRSIVHGGGSTPEYGAELLSRTVDVLLDAYPNYNPEATSHRWDRWLLLATSDLLHRLPDLDIPRLVDSIKQRPAIQWVNFGKGGGGPRPDRMIQQGILDVYNHKRRNRKSL